MGVDSSLHEQGAYLPASPKNHSHAIMFIQDAPLAEPRLVWEISPDKHAEATSDAFVGPV